MMPLCKVESVKVIGNVLEEKENLRRSKVINMMQRPIEKNDEMYCVLCDTPMKSPFGMYNGSVNWNGDEQDRTEQMWSYECEKFHNYTWTIIGSNDV